MIKIEMHLHELQAISDALLEDVIRLCRKEREGTGNSETYKKAIDTAFDMMMKIDDTIDEYKLQRESEALYHTYGTDH